MGKYSIIKHEFSFIESQYKFKIYMQQKHGAYYYLAWTNGKRDIMVLYDDRIDEKSESPIWIRIHDADSFGTAYDDVVEFRKEFSLQSGSPKERICYAAKWLRNAIESKTVQIE